MERMIIYLLAAANILVGFMILHRSTDRFGFETYRSFLERQEKEGNAYGTSRRTKNNGSV